VSQKNNTIASRLDREPGRLRAMVVEAGGWRLDASRTPIALPEWQARTGADALAPLEAAVAALFAGRIVNRSEDQPALHMALRAPAPEECGASAEDAIGIETARARMLQAAGRLYRGEGEVRTILHAGIGGSDLGPRLVADALDPGDSAVTVEWLTTLDNRRIARLLDRLDPAETALVIASKSFTTVETLTQARCVRDWMGDGAAERIWAATAQPERAAAFGVAADRVLAFPVWTGGRFSLWSGVGLSAAARIGPERWQALLDGAATIDRDVAGGLSGTLAAGLAIAVDELVRRAGHTTLGVVAYAPELRLLAEYLQQLVMESLGKSVTREGRPVAGPTAPLVFGGAGTDLQHSLFQALHQGSARHPLVLVGRAAPDAALDDWRREQLAHLLGQASALVHGRAAERPEQALPGDNPVVTLLTSRLGPAALGALLASLEHAVYLLGELWDINAFDQWGVEEGKRLAGEFRRALAGADPAPDTSLEPLLDWIRRSH